MFFLLLYEQRDVVSAFNVFQYITFRAAMATLRTTSAFYEKARKALR